MNDAYSNYLQYTILVDLELGTKFKEMDKVAIIQLIFYKVCAQVEYVI